jgi:16S rRNA (uracil1498-N3)-methyltransferase
MKDAAHSTPGSAAQRRMPQASGDRMGHRLYCAMALATGARVELPEAAAHHAVRVLRLAVGDAVTLFNGEGGEFAARLERVDARAVVACVEALSPVERESPLAVTLVQGLASADRMDYAIQKAVELGAVAVQPVSTLRSVARLDALRAQKRVAHWQQIAIAACEQCGRNRIPTVWPLRELSAWLREPSLAELRLLFAPDAHASLASLPTPTGAIECMVGPEGGLDEQEAAAALRSGFVAVRVGPRVLRTETAGAVVLSALNVLWGDWR